MRPFADGTHGFPRLVRDMARSLGKEARLVVEGENTEVDRDILERLELFSLTLLLPCVEADGPASSGTSRSSFAALPPSAILVVEDHEDVGAFAETLLSELGHEVTRARTGEEALDLTRSVKFDVVLSDVVMPGMGGLRLAEMLAEEQPELPVVLATGYSQEITQVGSGGRPVILKPYRLATLAEALSRALNAPPR